MPNIKFIGRERELKQIRDLSRETFFNSQGEVVFLIKTKRLKELAKFTKIKL